MPHRRLLLVVVSMVAVTVGFLGGRLLEAQDPLKSGTVLQRTALVGAAGQEAILVLRELPPGGASGWHTQAGNEIVYILEGSVVLEVRGRDAVTLASGEAFTTAAGDVHNVKNASDTAPGKALAFYIAAEGTALEELSQPAE